MGELKLVTFTGADERNKPEELAALSARFPFAEWAILLSATKTGQTARYPSLPWMQELNANNGGDGMHLAVHLCGRLARDFAEGKIHPIHTAIALIPGLTRIQINLGRGMDRYPDLAKWSDKVGKDLGIQIIVQSYGFKGPVVQTYANRTGDDNMVFLHDASGGRGTVGTWERPINSDFVGYAGGLRPENVESKLQSLAALGFDNAFWIDMESGVRTEEDILDLKKVEEVLKISRQWRKEQNTNG